MLTASAAAAASSLDRQRREARERRRGAGRWGWEDLLRCHVANRSSKRGRGEVYAAGAVLDQGYVLPAINGSELCGGETIRSATGAAALSRDHHRQLGDQQVRREHRPAFEHRDDDPGLEVPHRDWPDFSPPFPPLAVSATIS